MVLCRRRSLTNAPINGYEFQKEMPLYQYECEKCGERFDVRQKFVDSPLSVHENCGGAVHRLLSAPALQFKGSGFYITDYAKNSTSQPGGGASKKPESTSGSSEKAESSSSTPAPATESKSTPTSDTK
jgi:putative FmdB family regulatory protein